MLTAILRSVIPRSISSTSSSFGGINNVGARTSLASSFRTGSPLSLMGGSGVGQHQFREKHKSCLKTNKSASKRFIVRGKGRIKRGKEGRSHNTGHKSNARKTSLAAAGTITEKGIEERMRKLIRA